MARATRAGPAPFLQNGFRPFFLGASIWLAVATPVWFLLLTTGGRAPSRLDPLAWHQHEMLFGGVGAVVVGFLLTAVPNWTGRLPLRGLPLLGLWLWWLAARLVNLTSDALPAGAAALVDVGFLGAVTFFAWREIHAGRNWRNLPLVTLFALFALSCLGSHVASLAGPIDGDLARRLGIAAAVMLIGLVGGRVVPSFTRNWLAKQGVSRLPAEFGWFDRASLLLLALALLAWTAAPLAVATAWLALVVGVVHLVRLARWQGQSTLAEPLVLVLHVGYLWVGLGLVVLALETLVPSLAALSGVHALTAGAIGTMTLAVMTRASLGHTGRGLAADRLTVAIYALVIGGSVLRVAGDLTGLDPLAVRVLAGSAWSGAYLAFALHFGPMLVRPPARDG